MDLDLGEVVVGGCAGCAATAFAVALALALLKAVVGGVGTSAAVGLGVAVGAATLIVAVRLHRTGYRGLAIGLALGALCMALLGGPCFGAF